MSLRLSRLLPALCLLFGALGAGCSSSTTDTGVSCGPGTMLMGSQCVPMIGQSSDPCGTNATDACGQCFHQNCLPQCQACVGSTDCSSEVNCVANCSDSTCATACAAQFPNGNTLFDAVGTCDRAACTTACNAGSGGAPGNGGSSAAGGSSSGDPCTAPAGDACGQCAAQNCVNQCQSCQTDTSCTDEVNCLGGCAAGDQTCVQGCRTQFASNNATFTAFVMCLSTTCGAACSGGAGGSAGGSQGAGGAGGSAGGTCPGGFTDDMGCGSCVDVHCCSAAQTCLADATCNPCFTAASPPAGCSTNANAAALGQCAQTTCASACNGGGAGTGGTSGM